MKKPMTLESQLLRSYLLLLAWISGLLALVVMVASIGWIRLDQTRENNRARLADSFKDAAQIRSFAVEATHKQLELMRELIFTDSNYQILELGFGMSVLLESAAKDGLQPIQWVQNGRRMGRDANDLGAVPAHWQAVMDADVASIVTEAIDSPVLPGTARVLGAETLVVPIKPGIAVAFISPNSIFSNGELLGYGIVWALLLWLTVFLALFVFAVPVLYWLAKKQARTIAGPLALLSQTAEKYAHGELDATVEPRGTLETRSLAKSFNAMLKRLNEVKNSERQLFVQQRQFVADISHDLRTPLTAILGYTERAQRRMPEDHDLKVIEREAQALKALTNNLFELAGHDTGNTYLQRSEFSLAEFFDELVSAFKPSAWQRGVVVRSKAITPSASFNGDRMRMTLALQNLVENALRHTSEGGLVEISAQLKDGCTELMVQDTGAGIAPADLARIFERGFRGDQARTSRGGGLGLSIVEQIVKLHGGEIRVNSALGEGSCFVLRFGACCL